MRKNLIVKINKKYSENCCKLFKFDKNHFTSGDDSAIIKSQKRISNHIMGNDSGKGKMNYETAKYDLRRRKGSGIQG